MDTLALGPGLVKQMGGRLSQEASCAAPAFSGQNHGPAAGWLVWTYLPGRRGVRESWLT